MKHLLILLAFAAHATAAAGLLLILIVRVTR